MSLKNFYRSMVSRKKRRIEKLERRKTFIFEWLAIIRKRKIYKNVKWTAEQKKEFKIFWVTNYGKKISNRWHRLYQSMNGVYNVKYIPEMFYSTKIEPKINPFFSSRELSDKNLIELLLAKKLDAGVCVPETVLSVCNGLIYNAQRELISLEQADELLQSDMSVVIKPTVGSSSGEGVEIFDKASDIGKSTRELMDKYSDNFIVQKKIIPSPELARIYDKAINTIRITTYACGGNVYHCPISLRVGSGGRNVDNIHAGGLGIIVNDDGSLAEEAYRLGYGDKTDKFTAHPDSGTVFKDCKLSFMPNLISVAHSLHGCFPGIGVISWDITVDESNRLTIIEANLAGQGIWLPQVISGQALFGDRTEEILQSVSPKKDKKKA